MLENHDPSLITHLSLALQPLSEISYESCEPNNYEVMSGSLANPSAAAAGPVSKFHRSYSMGQGWGALVQQQHQHQQQQQLHQQQQQQPMAMAAMPLDGQPKVVYRRRNNSTSEGDGSLLMCYPSEHLRRLVPAKLLASVAVLHAATAAVTVAPNANDAQSAAGNGAGSKDQQQQQQLEQNSALLHRPAMAFMTQKHELDRLRGAMRRSLRIAACRIYALQALNWLLRSVTQGVCLHDLMWWFVSSLAVGSVELVDGKYEEAEPALEHPVAYTQISGRFAHLITQSLHVLLQSVADLTLHLPLGSPLQRVAIQCFGIRFRQADHQFLHSSHVFGNISKILSKSDEQNDAMAVSNVAAGGGQEIHCDAEHNIATATASGSHQQQLQLQPGAKVIYYTDLAGMFEVTVSSRPAMAESLTDNSTETFWESDEEDRNKCKIIEMSMTKLSYACKFVLVHIDNSRDIQVSSKSSFFTAKSKSSFVASLLQNKVLNVVFYAGQSLGDTNLIKSVDVDQKACVWIAAKISDETCTHFRLELHGPENTLRVRQIKLLGLPASYQQQGAGNSSSAAGEEQHTQLQPQHPPMQVPLPAPLAAEPGRSANLRLAHAARIQQQICEAETLRVFRLITGQVFGKLISNVGSNSSDGAATGATGVGHTVGQLDSNPAGSSMLADSLDLREHMVGILFSRSKLSHLQKQVIVHIVHAIRKEAQRAKEDWELANLVHVLKQPPPPLLQPPAATQTAAPALPSNESSPERSRAPDTYCFEMLSMVLALSGSVVGRSYLSQQHGLLRDLLGLLHTGSDRVQRQVTALLRRILPEITPESFAELLGVQRLPPADYSIAHHSASDFDMSRLGLLDIFLAVIAKSLQLQVKVKTTSANAASNPVAGAAAVPGGATGASAPSKPAQVEKTPAFVRLCSSLDLSVQLLRSRPQTAEQLAPVAPPTSGSSSSGSSDPFRFDAAVPVKKESKRNLNQRWFLNGIISTKQAESIIGLIRDLASVSRVWELSRWRY